MTVLQLRDSTSLDIHPDELLDRRADGTISDEENDRLERHLERCATCRFELAVQRDFLESALDDFALDDSDEELVESHASGAPTEQQVREAMRAKRPRTGKRRRAASLLVGGLVLLSVSAAAAHVLGVAPWQASVAGVGAAAGNPDEPTAAVAVRAPQAVRAPLPAPAPSASAPGTDRDGPASMAATAPPKAPPLPSTQATPSAQAKSGSAQALFGEANALRRRRRWDEAIARYEQLATRFPDSAEARLSRAIVARLKLDRGDATGAASDYDRYLKQRGGALTEEALVGRARALEKAGQPKAERAVWQQLLTRFPDSVHATRARRRIKALSP